MPTKMHILVEGGLLAIAIALPFVTLRPYWLRLVVSMGLPIAIYGLIIAMVPVVRWHDHGAIGLLLGGFYAAHLVYAWRFFARLWPGA